MLLMLRAPLCMLRFQVYALAAHFGQGLGAMSY